MKIQNMFQKNINRDINGVIKVAQDDEFGRKLQDAKLLGADKKGGKAD